MASLRTTDAPAPGGSPQPAKTTAPMVVALSGVTRVFGVAPAVVRADLEVEPGEVVLLRGPNGAGKSTLLRIIATALTPTYGGGMVMGFDLVKGREQIRARTEFLGHRTRLYGDLTAEENLRFACAMHGADADRVSEVLGRVGLGDVAGERVRGFSNGMRQRLAVARALLRGPSLLLLDEPYAGLDAEAGRMVDEAVRQAREEGRTVILATHDPSRAALATRTVFMDGGRILDDPMVPRAATPRPGKGEEELPATAAAAPPSRPPGSLRQAAAVAAKDLRIELRGRYALGAVLPFAATLLLAFGLALGPGQAFLQRTAPGLLWVAVLFAAVLSARRAYESAAEDGALEGLLLGPADKASIFLGKAAAIGAQLVVVEALVMLLVAGLFDVSLASDLPVVVGAFLLGTVGLAAVGALFGALDASARAREAVFPLLVLPICTPVLVAGVKATGLALAGRGGEALSWLGLLGAFAVAIVAAGVLVYGSLLED